VILKKFSQKNNWKSILVVKAALIKKINAANAMK